jgi:hypothetical protein
MAQAVEHHNEFSLDDYHHHVRMVLGCGINAAVREMARRIATRRFLLIRRGKAHGDAVVVDHHDFSINYDLEFDGEGWLRIVAPDPNLPGVKRMALATDDFDYSVVEQDVPAPGKERKPTPKKQHRKAKQASRAGAPEQHDWDEGEQFVMRELKTRGNPLDKNNQTKGWKTISDVARLVIDHLEEYSEDGVGPDLSTTRSKVSDWIEKFERGRN